MGKKKRERERNQTLLSSPQTFLKKVKTVFFITFLLLISLLLSITTDPSLSQTKLMTNQTHHKPNLSQPKLTTTQTHHKPSSPQPKLITNQAYHNPNSSQTKHITTQTHHKQNLSQPSSSQPNLIKVLAQLT